MYEISDRGWATLAAAEQKLSAEDAATRRDDERMVSARGGPHRYTDGVRAIGWCDVCGVAKGVHQ